MYQVVSLWLPTMAAVVQFNFRSCGVSGGQCGRGAGFL
jgi:alpha/beta superfamily hydrolase